jgi:hypothetical protein
MSDDRKRPIWPWIVVLLIGLPVLYYLSLGPACWSCERGWIAPSTVEICYRPACQFIMLCPRKFNRAMRWWWDLGCKHKTGSGLVLMIIDGIEWNSFALAK